MYPFFHYRERQLRQSLNPIAFQGGNELLLQNSIGKYLAFIWPTSINLSIAFFLLILLTNCCTSYFIARYVNSWHKMSLLICTYWNPCAASINRSMFWLFIKITYIYIYNNKSKYEWIIRWNNETSILIIPLNLHTLIYVSLLMRE